MRTLETVWDKKSPMNDFLGKRLTQNGISTAYNGYECTIGVDPKYSNSSNVILIDERDFDGLRDFAKVSGIKKYIFDGNIKITSSVRYWFDNIPEIYTNGRVVFDLSELNSRSCTVHDLRISCNEIFFFIHANKSMSLNFEKCDMGCNLFNASKIGRSIDFKQGKNVFKDFIFYEAHPINLQMWIDDPTPDPIKYILDSTDTVEFENLYIIKNKVKIENRGGKYIYTPSLKGIPKYGTSK